ncbi:MAG: type II CAAX endopeptidase family protein [Anaerosomatales bacterium]|nr:type II CAAX endopeptidase family protein [Anaerosomatales bacterium]
MRRHLVVWFYVLAFGISWLGWMPMVLGSHGVAPFDHPGFQMLLVLPAVGPAAAAVIVTRAAYGKAQSDTLLKALVQWRGSLGWCLSAVLSPIGLLLLARVMTGLLGLPVTQPAPQGELLPVALAAFATSLLSNPWEEVGWRGFALPHLQKRHTALVATLVVGALWGLWHLPLFFWKGNPISLQPPLPWFIGTVAIAFVYTWLYNSSGGSLLPPALFHVTLNTFGVVTGGVSTIALALVNVLAALVLVAVFGGADLSRRERVRAG